VDSALHSTHYAPGHLRHAMQEAMMKKPTASLVIVSSTYWGGRILCLIFEWKGRELLPISFDNTHLLFIK
jgi:hypothetical protein